MCIGVETLAIAGAGIGMLGSVMAAGGAAAEGRKAQEIANLNGKRLREAGRYQAKQIRKKVEYIQSTARVQAAARGLALSGSVLDVMADTAVQGEIDATNAIRDGEEQGRIAELQGQAANLSGQNRATSLLIGGFADTLSKVA